MVWLLVGRAYSERCLDSGSRLKREKSRPPDTAGSKLAFTIVPTQKNLREPQPPGGGAYPDQPTTDAHSASLSAALRRADQGGRRAGKAGHEGRKSRVGMQGRSKLRGVSTCSVSVQNPNGNGTRTRNVETPDPREECLWFGYELQHYGGSPKP